MRAYCISILDVATSEVTQLRKAGNRIFEDSPIYSGALRHGMSLFWLKIWCYKYLKNTSRYITQINVGTLIKCRTNFGYHSNHPVGVATENGTPCLQTKITNSRTEDGLCFPLNFVRYLNRCLCIWKNSKAFVLGLVCPTSPKIQR